MGVKRNIVWTGLMLVFLVMSVFLTTSDWIACKDVLPDEYMDVSVNTEQDARQSIFQTVDLINALMFVWRPEESSHTCFPLYFVQVSLFLKQPFPVILRI
jgi:hypothetical protein